MENDYFCNGMMEEILNDLQKVSELKVKSRTSVERYRNPERDISDIGRELNVSFIRKAASGNWEKIFVFIRS
jgi:TolB-like protein